MFHFSVVTKNYQQILALEFAIKEINENPQILPNITLGFHIYDGYLDATWTYHAVMQLISMRNRLVPNYMCAVQDKLIAVIGGLASETSHQIANILGIYKIPQVVCVNGYKNLQPVYMVFFRFNFAILEKRGVYLIKKLRYS